MANCGDHEEEAAQAMSDLKIPCRTSQFKLLSSLMGERHQWTTPSLFLYGHTGTGKSLVINTLVRANQLPNIQLNCVECYNQRFLYEHILNHLHGGTDLLNHSQRLRCENMNDFIRMFRQISVEKGLDKETLYIILDKAERLRDMEINILPAFLRLQELTRQNVCVILLTEIVWEKFLAGTGVCEPFIVHFPDYSREEMTEIMALDCPAGYEEDFYRNYVNLVLSVFHQVCRNLIELRHLASLNFEKYVEPINTEGESAINTMKLWRKFEPHLKKALQTVYLREVSSSQWERIQKEKTESGQVPAVHGLLTRVHVELPFYSKYLLIAAYLASYNPAKTDKRFFAKRSANTSKRSQLMKRHERTSNHMLGPKPFPLDRMMAIFYSIVEGRVAATANIFMQISSLVSLHLLGQVAGDDHIEAPKYKCLVSLDFIKSVSRTVNFEVTRYLYDFV